MKKMLLLASFLFVLVGCGHKAVENEKFLDQNKEVVKKEVPEKEIKNEIELIEKNIYQNEELGFQLNMPKEWNDYVAVRVPNNEQSISDVTIEFYLPTSDKNFSSLERNNKIYASVMKVLIWDLKNWENFYKNCSNVPSMDENGTCIYKERIIAKNDASVFVIESGQDYPDDLKKEQEKIESDFPNNFKKYFNFQILE